MKLLLTPSYNHNIEFQASFDEKTRIPLSVEFSVSETSTHSKHLNVTKQLEDLQNRLPKKDWKLITEFSFYDPESPKLNIALEGDLLTTLYDILYKGSNTEYLNVSIYAKAEFFDDEAGRIGLLSHHEYPIRAENMELDTTDNIKKHFRYIQKEVYISTAGKDSYSVWRYLDFRWTILVHLEVEDLVDLTDLLPEVPDKNSKMLEEKLFCDFEFISSDGVSVPCHKVIISACSDVFRAKCVGKLSEPFKDQMTIKMTTESVNALLEFIYCGKIEKPLKSCLIAAELFQEGHKYHIAGLEESMVAILLQKSNEWYDVDVAFNLLRFVFDYEGFYSVELKERFIEVLAVKFDDLNLDFVKETFAKFPQLAVNMFTMVTHEVRNRINLENADRFD